MGGAGQHDGRAGLLLAAGCTVGTARWAARKDAEIDDLLSGWFGLVWFGLACRGMLFLVSWFLVSTVVEARTFPCCHARAKSLETRGATNEQTPYLALCRSLSLSLTSRALVDVSVSVTGRGAVALWAPTKPPLGQG